MLEGETREELRKRLQAKSRAAPQKPDESDEEYLKRLVWNEYMRVYMRDNPKHAQRRKSSLRKARSNGSYDAEAVRKRQRRNYDRRRARLEELKSEPCSDCGQRLPPECIEFVHREGEEKLLSVGNIMGHAWEKIEAEAAKCDLVCVNCRRVRHRAATQGPYRHQDTPESRHYDKRRRLFDEMKSSPCADCGGVFAPESMDFDHLPGADKRMGVGQMLRCSWSAIINEIAKCDLVCANCHRIRTRARKRESLKPRN